MTGNRNKLFPIVYVNLIIVCHCQFPNQQANIYSSTNHIPYPYQYYPGSVPYPYSSNPYYYYQSNQNSQIPIPLIPASANPTAFNSNSSNNYFAALALQGIPAWLTNHYNGFNYHQAAAVADSDLIRSEIIDVAPEYQRWLLGIPGASLDGGDQQQYIQRKKPHYNYTIDTQTKKMQEIPQNLAKPIIDKKVFTTTIRRSFVYDSANPVTIKPVNIHLINGVEVTTLPPTTTTENENVERITSWYETK